MRITRNFKLGYRSERGAPVANRDWLMERPKIRRAILLLAVVGLLGLTLTAEPARADGGFLETVKKHVTVTSTVADNGDQNPYAVVVAPVSAGAIQKDDVLIDNFNNLSNLQGLGTTIVDINPVTRKTKLFAEISTAHPAMSGRRRPDNSYDDAQNWLGYCRQHSERGRYHADQG